MVEGLTVCNEIVDVVPIYCAPSEKVHSVSRSPPAVGCRDEVDYNN